MTIWIMPELDREGSEFCQFWLQGGIHNETPADKKKLVQSRALLGTFAPPFTRKE